MYITIPPPQAEINFSSNGGRNYQVKLVVRDSAKGLRNQLGNYVCGAKFSRCDK